MLVRSEMEAKSRHRVEAIEHTVCGVAAGAQRGDRGIRGVLQKKLTEQKLPFRQAVFESLKCFDDSFLDAIDEADPSKLSDYSVVIE